MKYIVTVENKKVKSFIFKNKAFSFAKKIRDALNSTTIIYNSKKEQIGAFA